MVGYKEYHEKAFEEWWVQEGSALAGNSHALKIALNFAWLEGASKELKYQKMALDNDQDV